MIRETELETADTGSTRVTVPAEPKDVPNSTERARRFSVQMPMRYRVNAESRWWKGTTENVSRSGVLFQAELTVAPKTPIEINMVLPRAICGNGAAEVVCKGTIVRVVPAPTTQKLPVLATTISHYRLVRP